MRHFLWLFVLCGAAQSGPLSAQQPAAAATSQDATYRIGPSDELKIVVFDEAALSGTFRVDADGSIPYSLVGRVPVTGKTAREIEQVITTRLLDYVRQPRVTVEVTQFRSRKVFIMGEVRTPGQYALEGEVTLLEVMALAGALTDSAGDHISVRRAKDPVAASAGVALPDDPQTVEVVRVSLAELQSGKPSSNPVLVDGDTVIVPSASRVFVTGHVRSPGAVVLRGRLTVQQAIALAGGITERGSTRGIRIRREKAPGEFVEVEVQVTDFVEPNDTIIVRQRRI